MPERSRLTRLYEFFERGLWEPLAGARRSVALARRSIQFVVIVGQGLRDDLVLLRASALTYYSVLALVPLLAIVLVVLNALGIREDLTTRLVEMVAAGSPSAAEQILAVVDEVNFGALGSIGAGLLFVTTILGIGSIEQSLNAIWRVGASRSWERRVPDYLAVVIVLPVLLGVAVSLGTTLESDELVGRLLQLPGFQAAYDLGLDYVPLVFQAVGFTFLYWFFPNTRVRVSAAALGGLTAAILFTIAQSAYVDFSVGVSRSNAV